MEKEANFSPSLASTDDVMEGNAISESNHTVLHQHSIGKTLAPHHSYSILSLTAQLKAIEDHFNSAHASIQERSKDLDSMQESLKKKFKELETKEQELGRVQEGLKRKEEELVKRIKGYGMKEGGLENAKGEDFIGTLVKTEAPGANRGGCVTIDGKWLQTYLKEHSEELDLKRNEVEVVLRLSSDPAQLVLDAIEGFYSPCLIKGDVAFDESIVRRSCILLLELLFKISSEIKPGVRKEILRISSEWMKKMGKDSENSLWEVVANVGESLDGKWLQMYLNEHSEELDLIRSEVEVALRLSLDPAQVVLDAIKTFYPPYLMKGDVAFKEGTVRRSCILLLELLFEISPEIKYYVKEEARRIAYQWMKKMRKDVEHSVEVFGFLKLVGSFGLTSAFDANELLNYLGVVAQPRQAPELFHLLGLADRKRSFVENLIRNKHQLEAIRFSYSLEMVHNFPPGPLLKDFLLQSHREAQEFSKRSPCKWIAATEKRIFEIRDVLKCIEEFKIENSPELSPKYLQNVISDLEREIANMKAMQLAVSAPNLALTPQQYPNFISTACPAAQVIVSSLSPTGHNPTTKFTLPSIAAPSSGPSSVSQTLSTTDPATVTSSSPAGQVSVSSSSSTGHKPATKFTFPSLSRPFSGTIFSSQSQPLSTTAPIMVTSSSPVAQVAVSSPSPTDHNPATKFTFPSVTSPFNDPSENSLREVVANVGESLDGKWLQMYLNEHSEELDLIRSEVEVALRLSLDPAQVVLDAIKTFYPPYLMKGDVAFKEGTVRRSCILLLELLFEISPEIKYCVKEEARRIACQWMEKMRKDVEHSVEVFGFLKLVGSFGLTSSFDANELLNYLRVVAQPRQAPELFHLLGLADRKRSFVENLIRNKHQLEAIRFSYSLEMVHNFPPGPLLKDFLLQSHREARKFRKRSPCERIAATEKRIFEIRDVLKCIEEFKIENSPEISPKHLQSLISDFEREIAKMKAMQLAVSAPNLALTPQHYPNFISTACPAAQVIVSSLSPTGHNPTTKFTLPSIAAPSSGPSSVSQTFSTTAPATVMCSSPAGQVSVSSSSSTGHKPATKFTFPSLSRPFSGTIFSSQSQPLSTTAPIMVTSSSPVAQVAVSSPSPTDHNPATKFTFPSVTSPFSDPIFSSSLRTLSTTAPNMVTSSSATQVTVPSLSPSDHNPATKFTFSSQTTPFKFNFPSQTAPFSGPMFSSLSRTLSTTTPVTVNSFSSLSKTLLTTAPVIVASSSPVAPSTAPITITSPFPTVTPASASTLMTQPKRLVKKRRPPRPIQGGRNKHARVVESPGLAPTAGLALETLTSVSTASPAAQVTISSLSLNNNPTTKVVSPSQTATLSCPIVSSLSRALSTTAPIMVTSSPPATPSTALVTFTSLSPTCSPTSETTLVTQPQPLAIYNSPPRSQHRGRNRRAWVGESVGLLANYGMSYHTPAVDYIWVPLYAPFEQRYSPYHMPFHYRRH